ncbi:MAG: hypothetical protein H0T91_05055 [Propionibacteriaceae bacterium]|nr:hypothetical protein [Propionibacteriaceae bacterium]
MHTPTLSPSLQRLIATQRREAEKIRAMHGDPVVFLGWVVRDGFEPEDLDEAYRESIGGADEINDEPDAR